MHTKFDIKILRKQFFHRVKWPNVVTLLNKLTTYLNIWNEWLDVVNNLVPHILPVVAGMTSFIFLGVLGFVFHLELRKGQCFNPSAVIARISATHCFPYLFHLI